MKYAVPVEFTVIVEAEDMEQAWQQVAVLNADEIVAVAEEDFNVGEPFEEN